MAAIYGSAYPEVLEDGGRNEIDVGGLSGLLADQQTPLIHTIDKHTDITRTLFVPVRSQMTPDADVHPGQACTDGTDSWNYMEFMCPSDFVSITSFKVVAIGGGNGDIVLTVTTDYGASGEQGDAHGATTGAVTYAGLVTDQIDELANMALLASLAKGDYVGTEIKYGGAAGANTINCTLLGLLLTYVAEQ